MNYTTIDFYHFDLRISLRIQRKVVNGTSLFALTHSRPGSPGRTILILFIKEAGSSFPSKVYCTGMQVNEAFKLGLWIEIQRTCITN